MKNDIRFKEKSLHGTPQYPVGLYSYNTSLAQTFASSHWHDEIEIVYVEHGTLYMTIGGDSYTMKDGDTVIVNPGEIHELYAHGSRLCYHAVVFDCEFLASAADDIIQSSFIAPIISGKILFNTYIPKNPHISGILRQIVKINTDTPPAYTLTTKALLMQLIGIIIDCGMFFESAGYDEKSEFLKKIITYVKKHFCEHISLSHIAEEFNMSPKYFCRFFKNNFHKTFVEYTNTVRIENAMRLLDSGNTVTQAALSSGFLNMSYFTRCFKFITGYTPTQYKKQHDGR